MLGGESASRPSRWVPVEDCKLKKQKLQVCSVLAQERGQDYSVMVASVVQHENDTATLRSMPQQLREEALKGYGIEHLADRADELTGA